jgi:hypothetical protein
MKVPVEKPLRDGRVFVAELKRHVKPMNGRRRPPVAVHLNYRTNTPNIKHQEQEKCPENLNQPRSTLFRRLMLIRLFHSANATTRIRPEKSNQHASVMILSLRASLRPVATNTRVRKRQKDCRTPRRCARQRTSKCSARFWSAAVPLPLFLPNFKTTRQHTF